jgi:hypothetical protein|tara:strand:+ start:680 stop:949 length:270 start_codon:yes stop_codon:yes gene_type:complete
MKTFSRYLLNYTMQAMIIMQLIWLAVLCLFVWLGGLDMTWNYIRAIYPQPFFLAFSTIIPFIVAIPVAFANTLVHVSNDQVLASEERGL